MQHLAHAVVNAMAFLELSDDRVLDPDSAVAALEMLQAMLQSSTEEEKAALAQAAQAELQAREAYGASDGELEFFRTFVDVIF